MEKISKNFQKMEIEKKWEKYKPLFDDKVKIFQKKIKIFDKKDEKLDKKMKNDRMK